MVSVVSIRYSDRLVMSALLCKLNDSTKHSATIYAHFYQFFHQQVGGAKALFTVIIFSTVLDCFYMQSMA